MKAKMIIGVLFICIMSISIIMGIGWIVIDVANYKPVYLMIEEDHPNLYWDSSTSTLWCATLKLNTSTQFNVSVIGKANLYVIFGESFNQTEVKIDNSPPFTNTYYVTNTSQNCTIHITMVSGMVRTTTINFVIDNIPPTLDWGNKTKE